MEITAVWWTILALSTWSLIALYIIVKFLGRVTILKSKLRGAEVRRGFLTEQWLPLVKPYPWNPQNFRFIGEPIDGLQFEDEEVVLVEFKSGASKLSNKQVRIRDLVERGKVSFKEVRVKMKDDEFEEIHIR